MTDFSEYIDLVYSISDKKLLEDFFMGITTAKERRELPIRVEIIKRLIAGETQHKIASDLGVGVATVTRGSKELVAGHFKALKDSHV